MIFLKFHGNGSMSHATLNKMERMHLFSKNWTILLFDCESTHPYTWMKMHPLRIDTVLFSNFDLFALFLKFFVYLVTWHRTAIWRRKNNFNFLNANFGLRKRNCCLIRVPFASTHAIWWICIFRFLFFQVWNFFFLLKSFFFFSTCIFHS